MNELHIFENSEFGKVRTIKLNEEPWFVASDICKALDLSNPTMAMERLDEDERAKFNLGRQGEANIINEYGLYNLILASRKKEAKMFKHWITHDVIPSLRKNGGYIMGQESMMPEQIMAAGLRAAESIIQQKEKEIERMRPKEIFADAVSTSHTSILVGDLAKLLKQNGVEVGQKRLFTRMREKGYLIKRKGSDWNMPTQKSMELGLFEVKESTVNNPDGSVRINRTTKVTGKGQQYFINKFLGEAIH